MGRSARRRRPAPTAGRAARGEASRRWRRAGPPRFSARLPMLGHAVDERRTHRPVEQRAGGAADLHRRLARTFASCGMARPSIVPSSRSSVSKCAHRPGLATKGPLTAMRVGKKMRQAFARARASSRAAWSISGRPTRSRPARPRRGAPRPPPDRASARAAPAAATTAPPRSRGILSCRSRSADPPAPTAANGRSRRRSRPAANGPPATAKDRPMPQPQCSSSVLPANGSARCTTRARSSASRLRQIRPAPRSAPAPPRRRDRACAASARPSAIARAAGRSAPRAKPPCRHGHAVRHRRTERRARSDIAAAMRVLPASPSSDRRVRDETARTDRPERPDSDWLKTWITERRCAAYWRAGRRPTAPRPGRAHPFQQQPALDKIGDHARGRRRAQPEPLADVRAGLRPASHDLPIDPSAVAIMRNREALSSSVVKINLPPFRNAKVQKYCCLSNGP